MRVDFKKPFEFEGKTFDGLELDLDALTGQDLIDAEREASAIIGRPAVDIDKTYQACIAAKASGTVVDMLIKLPAREFSKITSEVQLFLLA